MQTWKFSAAAALVAGAVALAGCGDDDGGDDEATGGRVSSTGGRTGSTGGRSGTGGADATTGGSSEGGAPPCSGSLIDDFVPQSASENPGPECQAYADCMQEGCGEIYEDAFGPDWESGDLGGGACGPSVPCLEDCGCDAECASTCIFSNLECASFALQLQGCYTGCMELATACQAERT